MFLKISQYSQKNTDVGVSCNFIKKRLQHRCLFCEHCEIFKNNFFYRRPTAAVSEGLISIYFSVFVLDPIFICISADKKQVIVLLEQPKTGNPIGSTLFKRISYFYTPENVRNSNVVRGYRNKTLAWKWLIHFMTLLFL